MLKKVFWRTYRVFNVAIFLQLYLVKMVDSAYLCNQLLSELTLDLFNILHTFYKHIEDVHKEIWCWKNMFLQNDSVLILDIFWRPLFINNGW